MASNPKESWEFMNNEILLTKVLEKIDQMRFSFIQSVRLGERMGIDTTNQELTALLNIFDQHRVAEFRRAYTSTNVLLSEMSTTVIGRFLMLLCSQQMWNTFRIFQNEFYNKPNTASGYHRYTLGVQELLMDQVLRYWMFVKADWKFAQLYGSCIVSSVIFKVQYQENLRKKILEYYRASNQRLFATSPVGILSEIMVQQAIVNKAPMVELFPGFSASNELARYISSKDFPLIQEIQLENNPLVYGRDKFTDILSISIHNQERSILSFVARYVKALTGSVTIVADMDLPILSMIPSLNSKLSWKISTPAGVQFDRSGYTVLQNQSDVLSGNVIFLMEDYKKVAYLLNDNVVSFTAMVDITKNAEIHLGTYMLVPYAGNNMVQVICQSPFEVVPVESELLNGHFQATVCKEFGLFKSENGKFVGYDRIMDEKLLDKNTVAMMDSIAPLPETIFDKLFPAMGRLDKFKNLYFILKSLKKCLFHLNKTSKENRYLYEWIVERGWRYDSANTSIPGYADFFENYETLDKYYRRLTQTHIDKALITLRANVFSSMNEGPAKSWLKLVYDNYPSADENMFKYDFSFFASERHFEIIDMTNVRDILVVINDSPHTMSLPMAILSQARKRNPTGRINFRIFSATAQQHKVNTAAVELFYGDMGLDNVDLQTIFTWDAVESTIGKLSKNYIVYLDGRAGKTNLIDMLKDKIPALETVISESKFEGATVSHIAEEQFVEFDTAIYVKSEYLEEEDAEAPVEEKSVEEVQEAPVVEKVVPVPSTKGAAGAYRAAQVKSGENVRGYLNRMKDVIITANKGPSFKVLDIGCGKGQDIYKFNSYSNLKYLGIDQSAEEIAEAERRVKQVKTGANLFSYRTTKDAFEVSPDWFESAKEFVKDAFDLISFQLSIHYAFRGLTAIQGLVKNMASLSKNGTKVIITTLDDAQIVDRVSRAKETSNGSYVYEYKSQDYIISLDGYSRELLMDGNYKNIGKTNDSSYEFTAFPSDEGARKATEYPVPKDTFVKLMAEQGFKLVEDKNAMGYEPEVQAMRKFNLSGSDKDMISLYKSYVFVKEEVVAEKKVVQKKTEKVVEKPIAPMVVEKVVEKVAEPLPAAVAEEQPDKFVLYSADNFQKKAPGTLAAESAKSPNDYKELKKVENWRRLLSDEGILSGDLLIKLENGEEFVSVEHAIEYFHVMGFNSDMANLLRADKNQTDLALGKDKKLFADYLKEFKSYVAEQKKANKKEITDKEKQWEARKNDIVNMIYERKFNNPTLQETLIQTKSAHLYVDTKSRNLLLESVRSRLQLAKNK